MNCSVSHIALRSGTVTFYQWGHGPTVIIALHGFAENAHSFASWGRSLPEGYSLYIPDLPLHGRSNWTQGVPFTVSDLRDLFAKMTGSEGPYILCGFSMGGRLALSYFQHYPKTVSRLVLLAPDGLKVNFWYWLSTRTVLGNFIFRKTMEHPAWFLGAIDFLGKWRLVNMGVVKYVDRYLLKEYNRMRLYWVWTCMRGFRPRLRTIRSLLRQQHKQARLIFGKYDRIIQPSQGYRFQGKARGTIVVRELPVGHQLLSRELTQTCLEIVTDYSPILRSST